MGLLSFCSTKPDLTTEFEKKDETRISKLFLPTCRTHAAWTYATATTALEDASVPRSTLPHAKTSSPRFHTDIFAVTGTPRPARIASAHTPDTGTIKAAASRSRPALRKMGYFLVSFGKGWDPSSPPFYLYIWLPLAGIRRSSQSHSC